MVTLMSRIRFFSAFVPVLLMGSILVAPSVEAQTNTKPLEISGWIPYWKGAAGTADILPHLQGFSAVMPFGYIVQNDGSLHDAFGFSATSSTSTANILIATARAKQVKVVPSVMWSNAAAIDTVLRSGPRRRALEDNIVALVKQYDFDGIDIDFENKWVKTRPYFSLFLQGLYARMGEKLVYCAIQPRTPPQSAFAVVPNNLVYADDYVAINKYCDRVEIMTYDQGSVDRKLNAATYPAPYIPIADPIWVEKVLMQTIKFIPKKKIMIGVATYGYEYELTPLTRGYRYDLQWAFNPGYAIALAKEFGITPMRNSAGELSFIYTPTTTPTTATTRPQHIVSWSDANAMKDKIELAQRLGVRGIAIFKIDGGEDPALWNILEP